MWIAIFGGLSPLRGPLATGSAEGESSQTTSTMQGRRRPNWPQARSPEATTKGIAEYEVTRLAQSN
jgi:hypothetical protein